MFKEAPEIEQDADILPHEEEKEEELFCHLCSGLITKGRWRIPINGAHEHTVFNPAGQLYTIQCFKEAPGIQTKGTPSPEFTWFAGYGWTIAHCGHCGEHLGWGFDGEGSPPVFFGLIKNRLKPSPN